MSEEDTIMIMLPDPKMTTLEIKIKTESLCVFLVINKKNRSKSW
jgi:hypothetical protein